METLRRAVLAELAVIGNRDRRAGPLLSSSLVLSLISLFSSKGDGGGGRGGVGSGRKEVLFLSICGEEE